MGKQAKIKQQRKSERYQSQTSTEEQTPRHGCLPG